MYIFIPMMEKIETNIAKYSPFSGKSIPGVFIKIKNISEILKLKLNI